MPILVTVPPPIVIIPGPSDVVLTPTNPIISASTTAGTNVGVLSAVGGVAPFTYAIVNGNTKFQISGSNLQLSAAGQGNITNGTQETLVIQATDVNLHTSPTHAYQVSISAGNPTGVNLTPTNPAIPSTTLANTNVGVISGVGGAPPYTYAITNGNTKFQVSGSNLQLSAAGQGNITNGTQETVVLQATDSLTHTSPTQAYQININAGAPTSVVMTPTSPAILTNALNGSAVGVASTVGGTAPFTYAVTNGNTKFAFSGNTLQLTAAGQGNIPPGDNETVVIQSTDTNGLTSPTRSVQVTVNTAPTGIVVTPSTTPTIPDNIPAGSTAATITVNGGSPPYTFSDASSNTKFTFSTFTGANTSIIRSASGTLTPGSPETVTVHVVDSAGLSPANTPVTFTIQSHTAALTLTPYTVTEKSGVGQTNVPFDLALPLAQGVLTASDSIAVYDSDGVTQLLVQEDNRASDVAGKVRFVKVTGCLPVLNANEKRQLTVKRIPSVAPATGTNISASDVLATAYDAVVTINDRDGSTYSASARDGLAAGTWTSSTSPAQIGLWRTGGGICTEYKLYVPLKTSGGTVHPQLFCVFHAAFYKAQRSAVSGPNPITAFRTDFLMENALTTRATPTDDWYDVTFTSGTNSASWIGSTPAVGLTLTAISGQSGYPNPLVNQVAVKITSASPLFNASTSPGLLIQDNTGGYCVITKVADASNVTATVFKAFGSATIPASTYRIFGINHPYCSRISQRLWWSGGKQGQWDSAIGTAWDTTTLTGGPFSYINTSAQMILNYQMPPNDSSVIPDRALFFTKLTESGTNPSGYYGQGWRQGTYCGPLDMRMPDTGGRSEIAPMPGWFVNCLIKYDSTAPTGIYGASYRSIQQPIHVRDGTTGLTPVLNGTNWKFASTGTNGIKWPDVTTSINNWNVQTAHMGSIPYLPYILTGDAIWAEEVQSTLFYVWSSGDPTYTGANLTRISPLYDETRGSGWSIVKTFQGVLTSPDRDTGGVLGIPKTQLLAWWSGIQTAVNSNVPLTPPFPGAQIAFVNNTGPGKFFGSTGWRWITKGGSSLTSQWQAGYFTTALYFAEGCGMFDANWTAFRNWWSSALVNGINDSTVDPFYLSTSYWMNTRSASGPGNITWNDWPTVYRNNAVWYSAGDPRGNLRMIASNVTLSTTSGTSITATFPSGTFSLGGFTFYQNGIILDLFNLSIVNVPTINAPGTGYAVGNTITLTVSTSSNTLARSPVLTVSSIGAGGSVTGVTVTDPGWWTAKTGSLGQSKTTGATAVQASTSGSGTGATFNAISLQTGTAYITAVTVGANDVITLNATGVLSSIMYAQSAITMYPFATTTLTGKKFFIPWPMRGDSEGTGTWSISGQAYTNVNDSATYYEYCDITQMGLTLNASTPALNPNAATALASVNAVYKGGNDVKWWVAGR